MKYIFSILVVCLIGFTPPATGGMDDHSPGIEQQDNYLAQVVDKEVLDQTVDSTNQDLDELVDEAIEHWEDKPKKGDPLYLIIGWLVAAVSIVANIIQYFRKKI